MDFKYNLNQQSKMGVKVELYLFIICSHKFVSFCLNFESNSVQLYEFRIGHLMVICRYFHTIRALTFAPKNHIQT